MKHIKQFVNTLLLLTIFISFFSSCSDSQINDQISDENTTSSLYYVEDGILHFSSDTAFATTLDLVEEMNDDEFKQWEESIGFKSLRSEIDDAYEEMDKCTDSLGFEALLLTYSDILKCDDDSTIVPIVEESSSYINIINRDGDFYISTAFHEVHGQNLYVSLTGDTESINNMTSGSQTTKSINATSEPDSSDIIILNYCQENTPCKRSGTKTDKQSEKIQENRRRCTLTIKATYTCGFGPKYTIYDPYIPAYIEVHRRRSIAVTVNNKKKKLGKYKDYKTDCNLRNASYTVGNYSGTFADRHSSSIKNMVSKETLHYEFIKVKYGNGIPNWVPSQPNITKAYAQATNRGIGDQWVTLDYKE